MSAESSPRQGQETAHCFLRTTPSSMATPSQIVPKASGLTAVRSRRSRRRRGTVRNAADPPHGSLPPEQLCRTRLWPGRPNGRPPPGFRCPVHPAERQRQRCCGHGDTRSLRTISSSKNPPARGRILDVQAVPSARRVIFLAAMDTRRVATDVRGRGSAVTSTATAVGKRLRRCRPGSADPTTHGGRADA